MDQSTNTKYPYSFSCIFCPFSFLIDRLLQKSAVGKNNSKIRVFRSGFGDEFLAFYDGRIPDFVKFISDFEILGEGLCVTQ